MNEKLLQGQYKIPDGALGYIAVCDGQLSAFEFKWQHKQVGLPKAFATAYPSSVFSLVHQGNFEGFIGDGEVTAD